MTVVSLRQAQCKPLCLKFLITKKPPVVRAALCIYFEIYFTLTVAILTENRSLIIRTAIRMTIRESDRSVFMGS